MTDQLNHNRKKFASKSNTLQGSIHNALVTGYKDTGDEWEKLGFMLGGPVVSSYLLWLIDRAKKNGDDCLAFVGRDGWILYQLFNRFFTNSELQSSYVYLPRTISLLSTLCFNGAPYYLEYILQKATEEGLKLPVSNDYVKNLETFQKYEKEIRQWAEPRRAELERHLRDRIGTHGNVAFVDLTSMWLTAFSAGHVVTGNRNNNNYILWLFSEIETVRIDKLPFEAALSNYDGIQPEVENKVLNRWVSVVNILEALISSPENRVIGLRNGEPIYGDSGAKTYYSSVQNGIERYLRNFLETFGPNVALTLPVADAVRITSNFAQNMDISDYALLQKVTFSGHIDNKSNSQPLV